MEIVVLLIALVLLRALIHRPAPARLKDRLT